jgi:anti-sigma B factor antagonist
MASDVRISVDPLATGGLLVKLEGPLNMESAPETRRALLKLVKKCSHDLSLDLSGATDIDTAAVAVMVEIARAIKRQGGELRVLGLSERARRLIRLANLESIFEKGASV